MFDSFESGKDKQARKRFAVTSSASIVLYLIVGAGVVALASRPRKEPEKKVVKVAFHKPAPKPPPPKTPPPPAPKPKPKKKKRPIANTEGNAPSVPDAIPDGDLAEGDESDFHESKRVASLITGGELAPKAPEPPPEPLPPPPPPVQKPVIMPEDAKPPLPRHSNRPPAYPEAARKERIEGMVILRVVITEKGKVTDIEVLRGDEPFVGAALAAVEQWRYQPALLDGEPHSVYRIIKVPFRLRS